MDRLKNLDLRWKLRRLLGPDDRLARVDETSDLPKSDAARGPAATLGFSVVAIAVGLLATGALVPGEGEIRELEGRLAEARSELRDLRGRLALREMEVERLSAIQAHSAEHGIPADLATEIHDAALAEGLSPPLAFRLIRIESSFRKWAVSEKGAVGYTQIKPSTARWIQPGVTEAELYDTETNLRLGFRYLRMLLDRYEGDMRLALLAYNQGPGRVGQLLAMGRDPANGYARSVLSGGE